MAAHFVDDEFQEQFSHPGGDARFHHPVVHSGLVGEITDFAIQGGSLNHTRYDIWWSITITEGRANIAGVPMRCTHPFGLFVEDDPVDYYKGPRGARAFHSGSARRPPQYLVWRDRSPCGWCRRRPSR